LALIKTVALVDPPHSGIRFMAATMKTTKDNINATPRLAFGSLQTRLAFHSQRALMCPPEVQARSVTINHHKHRGVLTSALCYYVKYILLLLCSLVCCQLLLMSAIAGEDTLTFPGDFSLRVFFTSGAALIHDGGEIAALLIFHEDIRARIESSAHRRSADQIYICLGGSHSNAVQCRHK